MKEENIEDLSKRQRSRIKKTRTTFLSNHLMNNYLVHLAINDLVIYLQILLGINKK